MWQVRGYTFMACTPGNRRHRLLALRSYRATTPHVRILRQLSLAATRGHLARSVWHTTDRVPDLKGFPLESCRELLDIELPEGAFGAAVFRIRRDRARFYVNILDLGTGEVLAFLKVAQTPLERALLREETAAIALIETSLAPIGNRVRFPRGLIERDEAGYGFSAFEPLPRAARPLSQNRAAVLDELSEEIGRLCPTWKIDDPTELTWWRQFVGRARRVPGAEAFISDLREAATGGVEVGLRHGDLTPSNVAVDGDQVWVVDWETSRVDVPAEIDMLSALHARTFLWRHLRRDLARQVRFFMDVRRAGRVDEAQFLLCVAFRTAQGLADGTHIVEHWRELRGR